MCHSEHYEYLVPRDTFWLHNFVTHLGYTILLHILVARYEYLVPSDTLWLHIFVTHFDYLVPSDTFWLHILATHHEYLVPGDTLWLHNVVTHYEYISFRVTNFGYTFWLHITPYPRIPEKTLSFCYSSFWGLGRYKRKSDKNE